MLHATAIPINLLQSQLAHNKKRINELQYVAKQIGCRLTRINQEIIERKYNKQTFMVLVLESDKSSSLKDLQKTRKQLKQLAILQKALKEQVFQHIIRNRIVKYEKIANGTT